MTRRAWAAMGVLGVLLIVMLVVAVRMLVHKGESPSAAAPSSDTALAPPPPSVATAAPSDGDDGGTDQGGSGDNTVLSSSDVTAAHQAMVSYLQALGSYTSTDRQASWQRAALAYTTSRGPIVAFTKLPSGRAWAECQHFRCTSESAARVLRDTATTDLPGSGAAPQVVSYVDLKTSITNHGSPSSRQDTQFTITATQVGGDWKVSGCTFAGIGDSGGGP